MDETHDHSHGDDKNNALPWRNKLVWIVFAVIAGFYLWTEHRAHLLGALPYLLLLACPLMHLLMHHGHGPGKTPPVKSNPGQP